MCPVLLTRTELTFNHIKERIMSLMDAISGTPEGDELDILGTLAEVYEAKNIIINKQVPIESLQSGLSISLFIQSFP